MEQNILPRHMTYIKRFRELMKRMHKPENSERYRNINLHPDNAEERRILELCFKLKRGRFSNFFIKKRLRFML